MRAFCIYLITNLVNGKNYVGQTVQQINRRFSAHKRSAFKYESFLPLHRAMRKYGIDNFECKIIEICNSIEELNESETKWILKLGTFGKRGYNCTTGGEGFTVSDDTKKKISKSRIGMKLSESHCVAISKRMMGENNPFYGKSHSKETIEKIKETLQGQMDGENNPFYGKTHTEETKKLLSENHKGKHAGEKHPGVKLTEKDVLEIRNDILNGINRNYLAVKFNVSKGTINKIATRENWSHI